LSVFNQKGPGVRVPLRPVFTSILLADRDQPSLAAHPVGAARVMAESQVSIRRPHLRDGELFSWSRRRTRSSSAALIRWPEAQMDRFAMCLALGLCRARGRSRGPGGPGLAIPLASLRAAATREEVLLLKERVPPRAARRRAAAAMWSSSCAAAHRAAGAARCGPRASIALASAAKALALFDGEEYVRPDTCTSSRSRARAPARARPAGKILGARARGFVTESCARCGSGIGREHLRRGKFVYARYGLQHDRSLAARAAHRRGWLALGTCGAAAAAASIPTRPSLTGPSLSSPRLLSFPWLASLSFPARLEARRELPRYATAGEAFLISRAARQSRRGPSLAQPCTSVSANPAARLRRVAAHARAGRERRNWWTAPRALPLALA